MDKFHLKTLWKDMDEKGQVNIALSGDMKFKCKGLVTFAPPPPQ
jgi:hypothetical protein